MQTGHKAPIWSRSFLCFLSATYLLFLVRAEKAMNYGRDPDEGFPAKKKKSVDTCNIQSSAGKEIFCEFAKLLSSHALLKTLVN